MPKRARLPTDQWFPLTPVLSLCRKKSKILFSALSKWGMLNLPSHRQQGPVQKTDEKGTVASAVQIRFLHNESPGPGFILGRWARMKNRLCFPGFSPHRQAVHPSKSKCHLFPEAFLEACPFGSDFSLQFQSTGLVQLAPLSAGCIELRPSTRASFSSDSTKAPDGLSSHVCCWGY